MTKLILRPRRCGKTWLLIKAWREYGQRGCIVVPTEQRRQEIIHEFQMSPEEQRRVFSADAGRLRGVSSFTYRFVDDAGTTPQHFLGGYVDVATWSGE